MLALTRVIHVWICSMFWAQHSLKGILPKLETLRSRIVIGADWKPGQESERPNRESGWDPSWERGWAPWGDLRDTVDEIDLVSFSHPQA